MDKQVRLKEYLNTQINPVFEELIVELLRETPENFIDFSIQWLNTKGRNLSKKQASATPNIAIQVASDPQKGDYGPDKLNKKKVEKKPPTDDEESEEEEDQFEKELEQKRIKIKQQQQRTSVSAEVYGVFNKREDFKPKYIEKSQEQKERILKRLLQAFMFQVLDEKEREIVIGAMEEVHFKSGDYVIQQYEEGNVLYVVDEGELDCFKKYKKTEKETFLKTYQPGEAFGELALLYNAPRAATIKAKTNCVLFSLDRETFNNIVKDAARKKREKYESALSKVPILEQIDPYFRNALSDGIKDEKIQKGNIVIKRGDHADKFYIVAEGKLIARKPLKEGDKEEVVYKFKEGDYFGELGLIHNIPRQATVVAETDCNLLYLEKETFLRLTGPFINIFKTDETRYGVNWNLNQCLKSYIE